MNFLIGVIFLVGLTCTAGQDFSLYDCPTTWEEFEDHCYFFFQSTLTYSEAKQECQVNGAFVLAVHSDSEHRFLAEKLDEYDGGQRRRLWWTSGRRKSSNQEQFFWEGDGSDVEAFFWHNNSIPEQMDRSYIMYTHDGTQWAWILGTGREEGPAICKISKEDVYKIQDDIRGPDYGITDPSPSAIPVGPYFTQQPSDIVHVTPDSNSAGPDSTAMECKAEGNPAPTYEWYRTKDGQTNKLDSETEQRYTFVNGRLTISNPSRTNGDDGIYFCMAMNELGKIVSETISLRFGYLDDFPRTPRSDVHVVAYQSTSIECNPPSHFPEVQYMWYKDSPNNFVRPDLKPYLFISHDSRLYFSEVTLDDVGNYVCIVNMPGSYSGSYAVESMPTRLVVTQGSPGQYDPDIGPTFPFVYPANPFVGDTILIECWASGSYAFPLEYYWDRIELVDPNGDVCNDGPNIARYLPMPVQARFSDHNRILEIPNIFLYDGGTYRCRVKAPMGRGDCEVAQVLLQSKPYFIVELENQYVDTGADLTWRCDASGEDGSGATVSYRWMKNGEFIPDETGNTLTFTNLNAERDNGMYQCVASNSHGTKYSSAELRVLSFAPSFAKYPVQPTLYATNQGNTTIVCKPESAPKATITWYKNGSPLNPGEDETSRIRQLPNGNLFISPVYTTDAGRYMCRAENDLDFAESAGNLTVLDTITIPLPPLTTIIEVNKTTFLHCLASYHPGLDVTYTWFHQDRLIEFEKVYRLGENRYEIWRDPHWKRGRGLYNGGLYIMHAQYMHTGRYTCVVESPLGDHFERWADVTVVGPPSEVAGMDHDSQSVTTTSVTVSWKAGGNNGDPIDGFVIEALNYWEGFWRIIYTNVVVNPDITGTYTYNITDLRPYSRYQIRMRAENRYGTSIPSMPTEEFTTLPVKPDLYPSYVGGGGGKVGVLTITWEPLDPWEENGPRFGYRVLWKPTGEEEFDEDQAEKVEGNIGICVILVGENNYYRDYDAAVQAFNRLNAGSDVMSFGPLSPLVTVKSAMGMPQAQVTNVRAIPYNSTACRMTWDPAVDSPDIMRGELGGYKLAYWNINFGADYESPWRVTLNGQMSDGLVIGLEPNTQYYFAVYVWTDAGTGPKSQYFLQRTLRSAPINQPVEVKIYIKSESAIHVYWRGVSTTHLEEPLEGYKVRIWREGQEIKVAKDYDAGKRTNLYIDDLNPHILYNLRVLGYSRGGDGTMSSPALNFMTGSGPIQRTSFLFLALLFSLSVFMSSWSSVSH